MKTLWPPVPTDKISKYLEHLKGTIQKNYYLVEEEVSKFKKENRLKEFDIEDYFGYSPDADNPQNTYISFHKLPEELLKQLYQFHVIILNNM